MFFDGRVIDKETVIEGDVCIIGAGAAGLSIAQEFIATGHKVILIEGGDLEFDEKSQELYEAESDEVILDQSRLRYFGGSTNCWMGRCRPLDDIDFKARSWVSNSGWPITLDDLKPYYERAGNLLKIGTLEQFASKDWDKNLFPGQYFTQFKSPDSKIDGAPFIQSVEPDLRFGPRFEKGLRKSTSISVYLNSNLVSLNTSSNGNNIENVKIATLDGNTFSVKARQFILALGGIENPRLLLASNHVEAAGIGNRYDQVGRYFMGHTLADMGQLLYSNEMNCFEKELISAPVGQLFFKLKDKIMQEERLLNAGLWVYREISEGEMAFRNFRRDLIQGHVPDSLGEDLLKMSEDIGDVIDTVTCNIQGKRKRPSAWNFWLQGEQIPDPENRVTLGETKDALGMRKLRVRMNYNETDKRAVLRTTEIFGTEITRLGLGRVRITGEHLTSYVFKEHDDQSDLWFGHDMGTTRMTTDPKKGVVDENCRVHGVNNLYVAGSSVFPTSGFANPTMTIIALAIRIADNIKSRLN
jgi:choline dehydrogenase-like flavoprotein